MASLFGSDTEAEATTQRYPLQPGRFNDITNLAWDFAREARPLYPNQMFAPFTELEQQGQAQQLARAQAFDELYRPQAMRAWESTLTAPDVAQNPYVQGMIEQQRDLLNRNLQENIMPGIASGAIGAGQLGGSRQGVAEGLAAGRTQDAIARAAAQTQLDAYGKGLAQQQYGLGYTPTVGELQQFVPRTAQAVGGAQRGMQDRARAENIMRFNYPYDEPRARLGQQAIGTYLSAVSPYDAMYQESQSGSTPSIASSIAQAVGIATGLGGLTQGFGGSATGPFTSGIGQLTNPYGTMADPWGGGFQVPAPPPGWQSTYTPTSGIAPPPPGTSSFGQNINW